MDYYPNSQMYIYIYQYNTHGLVKLAKHIYINFYMVSELDTETCKGQGEAVGNELGISCSTREGATKWGKGMTKGELWESHGSWASREEWGGEAIMWSLVGQKWGSVGTIGMAKGEVCVSYGLWASREVGVGEAIRWSLVGQGWGSVGTIGRWGGSCIIVAGVLGDGGILWDVWAGRVIVSGIVNELSAGKTAREEPSERDLWMARKRDSSNTTLRDK